MPLSLTDDKSTLGQVMAWCRQATSHYLSQCWPDLCRQMASLGPNELTHSRGWDLGWFFLASSRRPLFCIGHCDALYRVIKDHIILGVYCISVLYSLTVLYSLLYLISRKLVHVREITVKILWNIFCERWLQKLVRIMQNRRCNDGRIIDLHHTGYSMVSEMISIP